MVALQAKNLRVEIPKRPPMEVSFEVRAGEAVQLTGPSGCGKSTVLRILCRLDTPASGTLLLGGAPSRSIPPGCWRRRVCYLAQNPLMLEGTVVDNLDAGYAVRLAPSPPPDHRERTREYLSRLGMDPDKYLAQDARTLSGGEAARVALVRALLIQPEVLLCDEPTAALDPARARSLAALLGQWVGHGGALILVAHDEAPWEEIPRRMIHLGEGVS